MTVQTPISELDFAQVKEQLKAYMKSQDRFKDYNFDGSNMSVLLDVLSYNTFQNNFYANMAINEMFLDSAQLRESVVSHAKSLNYMPRSRASSRAVVNISVSPPSNVNPAFVTLPSKTQFVGRCGNHSFNFYNLTASTIYPSNGDYLLSGIEIFEGRWVTEYFELTGDYNERFILSNPNIYTDSIRLYVKPNSLSTEKDEYMYKNTIFGSGLTDKLFYIQGAEDEKYEVIFGKDKFGAQPVAGNVVVVDYLVSSGEEANGVNTFTLQGGVNGYPTAVYPIGVSEGGAEKESIESIRYFAPRSIQVQDRAVTENDYEILLKTQYPEIQAISVYGGEELDPPRYGRVVVAVDVNNAEGVSDNNKEKYASYLSGKTPVGIEPIIISPEFMHVQLAVKVYYNPKITAYGHGDLIPIITNAINGHNNKYLNDFKSTFRPSLLTSDIDKSDSSIVSSEVESVAFIPINPSLGISSSFDISFKNPLVLNRQLTKNTIITTHEPAIRSSNFTYDGYTCQFIDDGDGSIHIIRTRGTIFTYLKKKVGTVNYNTGRVIIRNVIIPYYSGSEIKIFGKTASDTFTAPKNRLLSIRPSNTYQSDLTIEVVGV